MLLYTRAAVRTTGWIDSRDHARPAPWRGVAFSEGLAGLVQLPVRFKPLGHPPPATPLLELQEVCEQLTGAAAGRQVEGAHLGPVQAEHGMMNGSIVAVLEV